MVSKRYYVYLAPYRDRRGSAVYVGCTNDVKRRTREHVMGRSNFLGARGSTIPHVVVESVHETLVDARRREREVKNWSSGRKRISSRPAEGWRPWSVVCGIAIYNPHEF